MLTFRCLLSVCLVTWCSACVSSVSSTAFDLRMLSKYPRYPVGYNPDDRRRPNYQPLSDSRRSHSQTSTTDSQTSTSRVRTWNPPVGYDPQKRKLALSTPNSDKVLDTINFENEYDPDGRLKLCTGIWMGNKILEKRCVWLDK